jgi:hypothetical protein
LYNNVTCKLIKLSSINITNTANKIESYDLYVSDQSNLGYAASGTSGFRTSTSDISVDAIYYGPTSKTSSILESDITGLNQRISNSIAFTYPTYDNGTGNYIIYAQPARITSQPAFQVGSLPGGFVVAGFPETVSITNVNGYTQDYKVWRSENILNGNQQLIITVAT